MQLEELVRTNRAEILRLAALHGAEQVRLFGSVSRGKSSDESDVDLLVRAGPNTSPWFPTGLILDLEGLLGQKVDVVTEDSIYWLLRRKVLQEARPL